MSYIPDVPEVMQISTFMSNSKCPELAWRFSDQVHKTVTEMMRRIDDFVKSEETYKSTELPKGEHPEKGQGTDNYNNHNRMEYRGNRPPRMKYGSGHPRTDNYNNHNRIDHYQPYLQLPPCPLMIGTPKKENLDMYYDYHGEKGHYTNDCYQLKRQLEAALESRKLSHLVKDPRGGLDEYPYHFSPGASDDVFDDYLIIEAEVESTPNSNPDRVGRFLQKAISPYREGVTRSDIRKSVSSTIHAMVKFPTPRGIVTLVAWTAPVYECWWFENKKFEREEKSADKFTENNMDVFAWQPSDMTQAPKRIIKHALNVNVSVPPMALKRRVLGTKKSQAVMKEVEERVRAGIVRPVKYPTWISNPVLVKKVDDTWRMCIDFKNLNSACPKDYYPLLEIDLKIEVVMGFPFKCFLDAYKGYDQIQMSEDDEEKTAFYTDQGTYCYMKIPFGLNNAGATYKRLVDSAFQTQLGRNLEAYVDDMVIKRKTKQGMIIDIAETFDNLQKINMKLNPKKCSFDVGEGKFLGYMVTSEGIRANLKKTKAMADMQSPKTLKKMQSLSGKLAALNRFLSRSAKRALSFFKTLKNITKENKDDYRWTKDAEHAFQEIKKLIIELPTLTTLVPKEILYVYLVASRDAVSWFLVAYCKGKQTPIRYEINMIIEEEEDNWMTPIIKCLEEGVWPTDENEVRTLRMKISQYVMKEGVLFKKSYLFPMLRCVGPLQANYIIREVHEGEEVDKCDSCQIHALVLRLPKTHLTSIMSLWPFYQWGLDILRPLLKGPDKLKFIIIVIDYFTKWMEAKPLAKPTGKEV
ncbi:reverse transcriptase domain-containing protein [Tanacetum coccineum]